MLAHTSRALAERGSEITETNWKLESVLRAATSVSIIAEDLTGRISLFNTGAAKLLGYGPDEVMGRSLASILHESPSASDNDGAAGQSSAPKNGATQPNPKDYETSYLRKDGMRLHVHVSITPLKNIAGKTIGHLHVAEDITPWKLRQMELRNKMEPLRLGKDALPNADQDQVTDLPEWLNPENSNDRAEVVAEATCS